MVVTVRQPDLSTNPKPSSRLEALARIASELELFPLISEATAFAERVAQGRFYVACVGQSKRGKSSLLNALLSEPILPTGVVPVTSVVTIVRHGEARCATIHRLDGTAKRVPVLGADPPLAHDELELIAELVDSAAYPLFTKHSLSSGAANNFSLLEKPRHVCRMSGRRVDRKYPGAVTVRTP